MGVCLAENSLMMVMENWGKSKSVLGADVGRWILGVGEPKRAGSSWVPPRGHSVQVRIFAVQRRFRRFRRVVLQSTNVGAADSRFWNGCLGDGKRRTERRT